MDPEQVVGGAQADQVGGVVASPLRTKVDVVDMHRRPAAARDLAAVPVAREDPAPGRLDLPHVRLPDLDEVRRHPQDALSDGNPAPGLGANRPQDAVYPTSDADAEGKPYEGTNRYVADAIGTMGSNVFVITRTGIITNERDFL